MRNRIPFRLLCNIIGCFSLIGTACQENTLYHSYRPVNHTGWYRNDTLVYTLDSFFISNPSYEYQVGIRHKDSYPYQDVWLGILPLRKNSSFLKVDSLHIYLSDSTGQWTGHGIGDLRQLSPIVEILPHATETDTIIGFQLIHLMKDHPLKGIQDIGLCIKKRH